MRRFSQGPLLLAALCALPFLWLAPKTGVFLADPFGELPIKLWAFEVFWSWETFFGGFIDAVSFPNSGVLNNPDPVGTLLFNLLKQPLGVAWGYNAFICLLLLANALSAWALARDLLQDELAALTSAVAFAFTPLVLVYCVLGAITDMLNLWPYPLAMMFLLRGLRRPGWRDGALAGLFAALGFVTCPYNFVVFAPAVLPAAAWLAWNRGAAPPMVEDPEATLTPGKETWRQWGRALLAAAATAGPLGGAYALRIKAVMSNPNSMMSEEMVSVTRHSGPDYPFMWPPANDRYMAYLSDYFAVGLDSLIVRDLGARLYRAFSPGYLVLALMIWGLWSAGARRRAAALWPAIAIFFAVASTGPFLPLTRQSFFAAPVNLVWMGLHNLLPGSDLLLEAFRYGVVVALGLSIAAGLGARALIERFGWPVGLLLPALVLAEVGVLSPVPAPPLTVRPYVPSCYTTLDRVLGEGAIIELPYTLAGSPLFDRTQLLYQTVHGRPIANEVQGFLPRYLVENQFTASLLAIENQNNQISMPYVDSPDYASDAQRLREDGFAGIVVNPENFRDTETRDAILQRLEIFGEPIGIDGRLIFVLRKPGE